MVAQAKIRITAEGAQALGIFKQLRQESAAVGDEAKKSAAAATAGWQAAAAAIGPILATLGGAQVARKGAELVDTYAQLSARLKLATRDQIEYQTALDAAAGISSKYQQSLETTVSSITKTYAALKPLGGTINQAVDVTTALAAAFRAGGASSQEAAAAMLQFSQALGKGVLNGDEFNSVSEAAPGLLRALAEGLGVPTAALKEMGAAGELSTAKIVAGLSKALPQLEADAASIPGTVGGAVQSANNALLSYVGTSETAQAASRLLIEVINSLADNIGPVVTGITTLSALIGAGWVGRMAGGAAATALMTLQQVRLAAAAASVAREMNIAGAATGRYSASMASSSVGMTLAGKAASGLLGLLGGPVGLIVSLGSLAAGWLSLARAKKEAISKEDLQRERASVASEIDALKARMRKGGVNILDAQADLNAAKRQLADLDALLAKHDKDSAQQLKAGLKTRQEIEADYQEQRRVLIADAEARLAALSAKASEAQRAAIRNELSERLALLESRGKAGPSSPQLQDPATTAAIEKEFKTREGIEADFRAKRDAYTLAKDAQINQARSRGDLATVQQLEDKKNKTLAQMDEDRAKAIAALDKDTRVTRLEQARETYSQEADLQADALARAAQANERAYQDGLVGYRQYLAQRAAAEQATIAADIAAIQRQVAAQREALEQNRAIRASAATPNERASADDAIARQLDTIAKLEADIERKKRDQVDAAQARRREESAILEDLRRQRLEIDAMLRSATGSETPDTIAHEVRQKYEPQLQSVLQNDQDPAPLLKLIDVETERAKFELLLRQFQEQRDALSTAEASVNAQQDAGLISEQAAETRILELRRQSLQALRDGAAALGEQSAKLNEVAGKTQPKEAAQAAEAGNVIPKITDATSAFEKTARSSGISAISTELGNILKGSKDATEGLSDMVGNFASSMLDLISKKLGAQLIESLFGPAGGAGGAAAGGGWGAAIATVVGSLFHTGGVVGQTAAQTRTLPATAWRMAPRYHTGGVVGGLRSNEEAAILMKGEEVLTKDDPRHVRNQSRQVGGLSVTNQVNITATDGSSTDQQDAARDLLDTVNMAIDQWAIKQSRPGGILGPR